MTTIIEVGSRPLTISGQQVVLSIAAGPTPGRLKSPQHFDVVNPANGTSLIFMYTGTLPGTNGGPPVTEVWYSVDNEAFVQAPSITENFYINGLSLGDHVIAAKCANANGFQLDQPFAVTRTVTPAATVPAAAVEGTHFNVVATGVSGQLRLDWLANPDDGGSPVDDHEYRIDGGTPVSTGSQIGTYLIGGLTNTQHSVEVRSHNAVGWSAWSSPATLRTPYGAAAGGTYTPDATATTAAGINAQLAAWNNNTGGSKKYLRVDASITTPVAFANYTFPDGVVVYGQGQDLTKEIDGCTINNCKNLSVEFFTMTNLAAGTAAKNRVRNGSQNSGFRYCSFEASPTYDVLGTGIGVLIGRDGGLRTVDCFIEECISVRWRSPCVKFQGGDGSIMRRCMIDQPGHDAFNMQDCDRPIIEDNWMPDHDRNPYNAADPSKTNHFDFMQSFADNTGRGTTNAIFRGNVGLEMGFNHPDKEPFSHGIFLGTTNVHSAVIQQNIQVVCNLNGIFVGTIAGGSTLVEFSETLILNEPLLASGPGGSASTQSKIYFSGAGGTKNRNIERIAQQGSNSLYITVSDYSTLYGALRQPGDSWNLLGPGSDASDFYPPTGALTHWNHATPYGAYQRKYEIFVEGKHIGHSANPKLAARWSATYNKHGRITA